jgi:hypothetical protein
MVHSDLYLLFNVKIFSNTQPQDRVNKTSLGFRAALFMKVRIKKIDFDHAIHRQVVTARAAADRIQTRCIIDTEQPLFGRQRYRSAANSHLPEHYYQQ